MEKNDQGICCYFHPDEVFVGVCPLCLYERLIVLAAKRCRRGLHFYTSSSCKSSKPRIVLPKMQFTIDSLMHRNPKRHLQNLKHDADASPTQEDDSFISIRFDNNNSVGAWEKEKDCKCVVEHGKQHWYSLRWRKRIGHVFHLITWKKSNRHVGSGREVQGGQWITNLMRRKTTRD